MYIEGIIISAAGNVSVRFRYWQGTSMDLMEERKLVSFVLHTYQLEDVPQVPFAVRML